MKDDDVLSGKIEIRALGAVTLGLQEEEGGTNSYLKGLEEGEKRGRQEVVDWIAPQMAMHRSGLMQTNIDYIEWQGKLEGWGIETGTNKAGE